MIERQEASDVAPGCIDGKGERKDVECSSHQAQQLRAAKLDVATVLVWCMCAGAYHRYQNKSPIVVWDHSKNGQAEIEKHECLCLCKRELESNLTTG